MAEWVECTLGDLITLQRGHDLPKSQMQEGLYPVVGSNGIIGFHNEYTTDNPSITVGRSGNVGKPFIYYGKTWSHNTTLYIKDYKGNDPVFVFYFLKTIDLANYSGGSAVPTLNRNHVHTLTINIPKSTDEQRKIGIYLKQFDDKIEENKRINNNLEQQAQAIFKYWFVDFEPFGKKMPTDWCNGTIDDLAKDIVCGKTPSTKKTDYYGTDIPFITIPDMHDKIYSITTERHLSVFGANSQAKKNLPKNSICVSCIGTAGLVTLVAEESQTNQQINSIIPKDGFSPYFIYLLMQTLSDTINKLGQGGSTIVNLNKSQFAKIQVTIPAIPAMTDFDKIVSPIFEKILQNQKENLCLTSLRDNLLSKLMSGELDVSNIDL
jgi:hypothetical protein